MFHTTKIWNSTKCQNECSNTQKTFPTPTINIVCSPLHWLISYPKWSPTFVKVKNKIIHHRDSNLIILLPKVVKISFVVIRLWENRNQVVIDYPVPSLLVSSFLITSLLGSIRSVWFATWQLQVYARNICIRLLM